MWIGTPELTNCADENIYQLWLMLRVSQAVVAEEWTDFGTTLIHGLTPTLIAAFK
jgi:hypothetical protein